MYSKTQLASGTEGRYRRIQRKGRSESRKTVWKYVGGKFSLPGPNPTQSDNRPLPPGTLRPWTNSQLPGHRGGWQWEGPGLTGEFNKGLHRRQTALRCLSAPNPQQTQLHSQPGNWKILPYEKKNLQILTHGCLPGKSLLTTHRSSHTAPKTISLVYTRGSNRFLTHRSENEWTVKGQQATEECLQCERETLKQKNESQANRNFKE